MNRFCRRGWRGSVALRKEPGRPVQWPGMTTIRRRAMSRRGMQREPRRMNRRSWRDAITGRRRTRRQAVNRLWWHEITQSIGLVRPTVPPPTRPNCRPRVIRRMAPSRCCPPETMGRPMRGGLVHRPTGGVWWRRSPLRPRSTRRSSRRCCGGWNGARSMKCSRRPLPSAWYFRVAGRRGQHRRSPVRKSRPPRHRRNRSAGRWEASRRPHRHHRRRLLRPPRRRPRPRHKNQPRQCSRRHKRSLRRRRKPPPPNPRRRLRSQQRRRRRLRCWRRRRSHRHRNRLHRN